MTNFWTKLPRPFTVLAPMDDVTDDVFRQVILHAGRPDVFFTEFTNADGLVHGGNGVPMRKLLFDSSEHPIVAQIWGTNPENLERAARIVKELGFDGVDINMGCAVKDVIKKGAGAGLIGNYELADKIIDAVQKGAGGLPVSVKTRLGNRMNIATEWTRFLLGKNIAALTIHARTAKQMSGGLADWDEIERIVKLRDKIAPKTIVIGNGDVEEFRDVDKRAGKYGVDGVMIGRGVFKNPWVFCPGKKGPTKEEYLALLKYHLKLFEKTWDGKKNFSVIKKYFKIYVRNFDGAGDLRAKLMETKNINEAMKVLGS